MPAPSLVLIPFLLTFGALQDPPPSTADDCREYDRVSYAAPRRDWPGSIVVERVPADALRRAADRTDVHRSPYGTAAYIFHEPDTTQPGPWTTIVEISGNTARPIRLRVRLDGHTSGGARARWISEKLLWLQLWRGRILSTDAILDIETGRLVYEEDAYYNSLILPCSMKTAVPK